MLSHLLVLTKSKDGETYALVNRYADTEGGYHDAKSKALEFQRNNPGDTIVIAKVVAHVKPSWDVAETR